MKHVFLCHSSRDKAVVRRVAADLRKAGIPLWFDEEQINIGDNFIVKISDGLAGSAYILVFLSPSFLTSEWVKQEWSSQFYDEITSKSPKVIPLLLDDLPEDVPPPVALLRAKRYVDLRQSYEQGMHVLLTFLTNRLLASSETAVSSSELGSGAEGSTLQVYPSRDPSGNLSISYWLDGEPVQQTSARAERAESVLASLAQDFPRIQYRFGQDATASVQRMAQSFSRYLLPPSVRQLLHADRIRRLRVMLDETSPVLPWELVHDGDGFVGLKVFVVNSPAHGQGSVRTSTSVRSVLVVEGLTSIPGMVDLDPFMSKYLTRIDAGNASIN